MLKIKVKLRKNSLYDTISFRVKEQQEIFKVQIREDDKVWLWDKAASWEDFSHMYDKREIEGLFKDKTWIRVIE